MVVWKLIFTPLWDVEKIERLFETINKKGYFLTGTILTFLYRFKKNDRKSVKYFFVYKGKANRSMAFLERDLRKNHNAVLISSFFPLLSIYEYKETNKDDILTLKAVRSLIIKDIIKGNIILKAIFFICVLTGFFFCEKGTLYLAILFISFLLVIIDIIGLFKQRKKCVSYESLIHQLAVNKKENISCYNKSNTYNIIYRDEFDMEFSGLLDPQTVFRHKYGRVTKLYSPTKPGYKFCGWYLNKECIGNPKITLGKTNHNSDIFVYARWKKQ